MFLQPAAANGAVITVTGNGDTISADAQATLREAITSINNQADVNADVTLNRVGNYASLSGGTAGVINFNIAGTGVQVISVTGVAEPTIVRPLTINGYSQVGAAANTLANADNAVILIELDGASGGAGANGLTLGAGSSGTTIKGLDITNFAGNGIVVQSNGNSILGNFIGVDPTGTTRIPNGTFPTSGDKLGRRAPALVVGAMAGPPSVWPDALHHDHCFNIRPAAEAVHAETLEYFPRVIRAAQAPE